MDAYHALAGSYDRLTNDVDYQATVDFYWQILRREGLAPRTAVDLACGTGSVALLLARQGLHVTAVDMSEEMLCAAAQKAQEIENAPVFVCQRLLGLGVESIWYSVVISNGLSALMMFVLYLTGMWKKNKIKV